MPLLLTAFEATWGPGTRPQAASWSDCCGEPCSGTHTHNTHLVSVVTQLAASRVRAVHRDALSQWHACKNGWCQPSCKPHTAFMHARNIHVHDTSTRLCDGWHHHASTPHTHTCVCVSIPTHQHGCMHTHQYVCVYFSEHVHVCRYVLIMHILLNMAHAYINMHMNICMHMNSEVCLEVIVNVCVCAYVCVCMHVYVVYKCMWMRMFMSICRQCMWIRTCILYIYIYIYIFICICLCIC
jgi:hypothetical protein